MAAVPTAAAVMTRANERGHGSIQGGSKAQMIVAASAWETTP
jgi:hypothetical protein